MIAALLAAACDEPDPNSQEIGCSFGPARHELATASGPLFHDLALLARDDGALALWSDRGGLFARDLDAEGAPRGDARRLGPPCPGGVDATDHGDEVRVACVRPGDPDRDRPGAVVLLDAEGATHGQLTPIRGRSAGISVAARRGRLVIGYRDADETTARARIAEQRADGFGEPETLSQAETSASAPSVAFIDGQLHYAWTESWSAGGGVRGHLLVQREGDPPRPSLSIHRFNAHPHLVATHDGTGAVVTLRDARPAGASERSFTGRLDDALRLNEDAMHSPSRADAADGAPRVIPCGDHFFSVATRRSSRGVTMVTLRRLDEDLARAEDEHQIYEYHRRFPLAAPACVQDRLLVLVGERQTDRQPSPRLTAYSLLCAPGRAHARTPP